VRAYARARDGQAIPSRANLSPTAARPSALQNDRAQTRPLWRAIGAHLRGFAPLVCQATVLAMLAQGVPWPARGSARQLDTLHPILGEGQAPMRCIGARADLGTRIDNSPTTANAGNPTARHLGVIRNQLAQHQETIDNV
jgi:hypothetical protein